MVLRLRGGGEGIQVRLPHGMGIAAGGSIQQTVTTDPYLPEMWHKEAVIVFNVQILNAGVFESVTNRKAPTSPITAQTYANLGLPFFSLEDKPSGISGAFSNVKSVAQIDGEEETSHNNPIQYLDQYAHAVHPDSVTVKGKANVYRGGADGDIMNPLGPFSEFRCLKELLDELQNLAIED